MVRVTRTTIKVTVLLLLTPSRCLTAVHKMRSGMIAKVRGDVADLEANVFAERRLRKGSLAQRLDFHLAERGVLGRDLKAVGMRERVQHRVVRVDLGKGKEACQ